VNPNDPNIALLEYAAEVLGTELCERLVFIGGAVAGVLITDPAQPAIRATDDVDLVVPVLALSEYHQLEQVLRSRGLLPDMGPDAPICRWRFERLIVDVMPTLKSVLGFSNRWYPLAAETAQIFPLPGGRCIRVVTAPAFIATKLEAFASRGRGDYLFSHDLGDVIAVIDGRGSLREEVANAEASLRIYLAERFAALLVQPAFIEALPGHLPADAASQARLPDLMALMRSLAAAVDGRARLKGSVLCSDDIITPVIPAEDWEANQ
jgi:hypothetical protein